MYVFVSPFLSFVAAVDDEHLVKSGGEGASSAGGDREDDGQDRGEEENPWSISPPENLPAPEIYGECKLPISPAVDPDIDQQSGLRFGNRQNDYFCIITAFTNKIIPTLPSLELGVLPDEPFHNFRALKSVPRRY